MKNKKLFQILTIIFSIGLISLFVILANKSFAVELEDGVRLTPDSTLIYYIDVIYDGTDAKAVTSSDSATADVFSDYIYVEDKIPEGLIFDSFLTTDDGTIGAVKRSDNSSCPGSVVDGVDGLNYDSSTRMVTFKVKNLQAGCMLTVGIVTTTPELTSERVDFYNTAFARENDFMVKSNTVHAFLGNEDATLYSVTYNYTGDVPDSAPDVPSVSYYNKGTSVGVEVNPNISDYEFSGWRTDDATVSNGTFTMPEADVTFTGSFTEKDTYDVTYVILGDTPSGFVVPSTKSYSALSDVKIDSLSSGDIVSGYKFLGWTSSVTVDENGIFKMPDSDVTITGTFEKIKYSVSYQFQGSIIPSNASELLPATVKYAPGEEVTLAPNPTTSGYKFLGWYKSNTFIMPEEDVVITGEWMLFSGYFTPSISISISNEQDVYQDGDVVNFNIVVTNNSSFALNDVMLQERLTGATFTDNGNGYTVMNDSFVKISTLAANSSMTIASFFAVDDVIVNDYINVVELTGALADSGYYLDTSKDYKVSSNFKVSNVSLNINLKDQQNNTLDDVEFTLYKNASLTEVFDTGTSFKALVPGTTYYLKQTKASTGYQMLSNTYTVVVDNDGNIEFNGVNKSNTTGEVEVNLFSSEIDMLPNTGGLGNLPYVIIGVLIIFISSVGYVSYTKKKGVYS